MDKLFLKFLLWLVKLFASKNIDFEKLKIITETKVMMDRRRAPASWKRKQQKEMKNPLLLTQIMYFFMGFLIGAIIFAFPLLTAMIFIHAYLLFMMAMTLITDFSSVLLDTADNQIILPKPVNSRTLFISRVVHVLVYLLQFVIAIAGAPLLFIFIKYGALVGLTSIGTMSLMVAFAVFVTYLLYALILRFADEQKIKDIVGYFQIFMTIFFAVGYQIIPRMLDFEQMHFNITLHWYSYLLPPVWMAVAIDAIHQYNFDTIHLAMIAATVLIPIVTVWVMVKFLAPSFSRKLGALGNASGTVTRNVDDKKKRKGISQQLSPVICKSQTEAAGFEHVWKMTSRDKNFKVQFYPSLAYLLVFAFIFVFKSGKDIRTLWEELHTTKMFLWFVYLPLMTISSCLNIVPFNENFSAAWIYQAVPLQKPGEIISGMVKSLLTKFFMPVYLLIFSFALFVWGPAVIDDFIFGFFNNLLIFMIMTNLIDHYLPFSQQANIKQQTGKFIRVILQLIMVAALIGLHYLALKIYWLPSALIPVSAIGAFYLLKNIQDLPWKKIAV